MERRVRYACYGVIGTLLLAVFLAATTRTPPEPEIDPVIQRIELKLDSLEVELKGIKQELARVVSYADQYDISTPLAGMIYRTAKQVGIDPDIAFSLVWVESRFNPRAVSHAGAIGLAQVMPATAQILQPGITREELFDPETNLRLGFRYLRDMLQKYDGDVRLALLAYNRGPGTVDRVLAMGQDPNNGYADWVLTGI